MVDQAPTPIRAVVLDLDDTVVTWQTLGHWQWAWKPNGPVLSERRVRSVLRRAQHRWDRERWHALAEAGTPGPVPDVSEYIAATLQEVAGHPLPPEEVQAVVRRFLSSTSGVEEFPDARAALGRLGSAGRPCWIATSLPKTVAEGALRRVGIGADRLIAWGDDAEDPPIPSRAAFRKIVARLGGPARSILYVGDLFWSDYRAAARSGMTAVWLDRENIGERTGAIRVRDLSGVDKWLESPPTTPATEPEEPSSPEPGSES